MQATRADQIVHGGAGLEGAVEVDIRPFVEQRVPADGVAHPVADLGGEALIRDREGGQQVTPELVDDVFAELDGVEGQRSIPLVVSRAFQQHTYRKCFYQSR